MAEPSSLTGLHVGAFVVQAPLGAGGMGTVYRALDTKLNRPVAIKFLPHDLASPDARRRFQREAQTASSLNHPHILTVLDAGEIDGRQYLVTEFVDGGNFREWLRAPHDWRETIGLLTGVADGLASAHDAGILHRDIKPDNILITKSGYAKLADFGLAKLHEPPATQDAETVTDLHTRAGTVIGTVAYMSPEQAVGGIVDTRSDIFSFGVVLFEALAGRRPFAGPSQSDTLQAIIRDPPEPLGADVPSALRAVIEKALEKNPANRFRSMHDVVVDLRRALRGEASATPDRRGRQTWRLVASLGGVVVVLAVAAFMVATRARPTSSQPVSPSQYTPLTNFADSATQPALSPDGRMLTFIRGESPFFGRGQIYVKLLPDGEPVQLTHDDLVKFGPRFAPDGAHIAYSSAADEYSSINTQIVPVLGGEPQLLLANAEGLTWVDRGAQPRVLFSEMTGRSTQMVIVSATESRREPRTVYAPPADGMAHRSVLSPDGRSVLVAEMDNRSWLPCRVVPFDGAGAGRVVGPPDAQCTDGGWSPDGKWIYVTASTASGVHVWRQSVPDGVPEQLTFGVTEEHGAFVAPDGRSFVTSVGTSQSTIWLHDGKGDRQMTSEGWAFRPSISPDGKTLYYVSRVGGTRSWLSGALWAQDIATNRRRRLLPDFQIQQYTISRDSRWIVFVTADESGHSPVWIASIDGSAAPRQLSAINAAQAHFGRPGEVIFGSVEPGHELLYRVDQDGSNLRPLVPPAMVLPFAVSPDGQWVTVMDPTAFGALIVHPTGGGSPVRLCDNCSMPQGTDPIPAPLSWSADGRVAYLKFGDSTFAVPLPQGQMLPTVPHGGFPSKAAVAKLPGARLLSDQPVYPGPDPAAYVFTKTTTLRNIYRVPIP